MEIQKAKEIVTLLANGVDPTTGEIFPDDCPYNNPSVIRALFTVLGHLRMPKKQGKKTIEERQSENIANGRPKNTGLPWTDELKQELATMFKQGGQIDDLAPHFERSRGAILSELVNQVLIDQNEKQNYQYNTHDPKF